MKNSEMIENDVENSTINEISLIIDIEIFFIEETKTLVVIFNQTSSFADLSDINLEEDIVRNSTSIETSTSRRSTQQIEKRNYKQLFKRDFVKTALSSHDIKTFNN